MSEKIKVIQQQRDNALDGAPTSIIEGYLTHDVPGPLDLAWRQRDQLLEALRTIQHSISQAKVFGNDWRRELKLIEEVVNNSLNEG